MLPSRYVTFYIAPAAPEILTGEQKKIEDAVAERLQAQYQQTHWIKKLEEGRAAQREAEERVQNVTAEYKVSHLHFAHLNKNAYRIAALARESREVRPSC